ncbi:MAG: hypothetical protein DMG68_17965 [Acidobacteria bacterium]|nr:MAG: hypothetical protein DMG68_17965 [Acidobacteriota bacterium]
MLPHVLLFASDERTARFLAPVLCELEFEVEHCKEIFAAVEKLTSRSYQAIIADWTQELEASFFLKTARELKPTKSAFMLAIVEEKNVRAAFQVGVNGVLVKPVAAAQARNTLLAARELITGTKLVTNNDDQSLLSRQIPEDTPGSVHDLLEAERLESAVARSRRPVPAAVTFAGGALRKSAPRSQRWVPVLAAFVFVLAGIAGASWKLGYWAKHAPHGQVVVTAANASMAAEPAALASVPEAVAGGDPISREVPPAFGFSVPSPRQSRLGPALTEHSPKAKPHDSVPTLTARYDWAADESPLDVTGISHPLPDSLLTPVPAMTARAVPAKLSSGGTKWTGEPIALPEETSHAMLLHQVSPSYPEQALRAGIQGAVVLHAWVARDGSIRDLKLMQGSLLLGRAAFDAVKQWRYRPYRLNGEIVEMQTSITIDFQRQ